MWGAFLVQNHSAPSICQKGRESVAAGARALFSYTGVYICALNNYSSPPLLSTPFRASTVCARMHMYQFYFLC